MYPTSDGYFQQDNAPCHKAGIITDILIIGQKLPHVTEYCLTLDGCSVKSLSSVRNLGVLFDANLSFESHMSCICKTLFFHLRNISKLHHMLSLTNGEQLLQAFMTSRLDYCNALLGGYPARLINKLQIVLNAAARVLTRTRKYDHISIGCIGCLLNIVYILKY